MQRLDSWDDLRFFLAVAREGSLAAAARSLGVNQSTVFRRINQLEEGLGARLFDRQARGYALTGVGEDMLARASRIEDDVLALDRSVLGADAALHGTVRVTTVDEVLGCLAPHLKCFRDEYPGISLEVNTELRLFSLGRREADVAIRPGRTPTEPDVVGRNLVRIAVAAYASPAYLAGRKRPRKPASLADHDLIGFDRSGVAMVRWLYEAVAEPRFSFRSNSMVAQMHGARAGLGVAILPRFMGDSEPDLEHLFTVDASWDYHLWLLTHADLRQTARVRAFVEFVTEAITADRAMYEGTGRGRRTR